MPRSAASGSPASSPAVCGRAAARGCRRSRPSCTDRCGSCAGSIGRDRRSQTTPGARLAFAQRFHLAAQQRHAALELGLMKYRALPVGFRSAGRGCAWDSWPRRDDLSRPTKDRPRGVRREDTAPLKRMRVFPQASRGGRAMPLDTGRRSSIIDQIAAAVAELADALDSGSSIHKMCRFNSCRPHSTEPGYSWGFFVAYFRTGRILPVTSPKPTR